MDRYTGKWVIEIKRHNGKIGEISVLRDDNIHGKQSYGWYKEDEKICVWDSGGPCRYVLHPWLVEGMIELARELAERLNESEGR